jgi:hypothetical protein
VRECRPLQNVAGCAIWSGHHCTIHTLNGLTAMKAIAAILCAALLTGCAHYITPTPDPWHDPALIAELEGAS